VVRGGFAPGTGVAKCFGDLRRAEMIEHQRYGDRWAQKKMA